MNGSPIVFHVVFFLLQLLRRENLDLKLTPYKVLATSSKHGKLLISFYVHFSIE